MRNSSPMKDISSHCAPDTPKASIIGIRAKNSFHHSLLSNPPAASSENLTQSYAILHILSS